MNIFRLFGEIAVKNDEANKAITDTTKKAEESSKKLKNVFSNIGKFAKTAGTALVTAGTAIAGAMVSLADNTRDYRTEMGKLNTAFITNGHSSETAIKTYKDLQAVLGETDQAVEAANHLAVLCSTQEELQKWTDICTGVYATFGASLPIESLTEAANETAKTGVVTGSLADALNWAGISEDAFNMTLAACSSEQERQGAIMNTLIGTYKNAADQYKETNAKVMDSNRAHDNLNAAMAKLGDAAEPAVTMVINACAKLAEAALPLVEGVTKAVLALGDAWVALDEKMKDITASITVHTNNQAAAVSSVGSAVTGATGSSFLGSLSQILVNNFSSNPDAPWMPRWNAEGAIFSRPTIFDTRLGPQGVGEAGPEAVAPIDKLQGYVREAVRDTVGGMQFNVMLDTGILVGQLAPKMDQRLGTISGYKGRGN